MINLKAAKALGLKVPDELLVCTEGMLDRFAPLAHLLRMLVEPALNGFENVLMLPSCDPSLLGGGTAMYVDIQSNHRVRPVRGPVTPVDVRRNIAPACLAGRDPTAWLGM